MKVRYFLLSNIISILFSTLIFKFVSSKGINSNIVGYPSYTGFNSTIYFSLFLAVMIAYPLSTIILIRIIRIFFKNVK